MVGLNPDLLLEVPDTPDRSARATGSSPGPSLVKNAVKVGVKQLQQHRRGMEILRKNDARRQGEFGQGTASRTNAAPLDTEHLFRQAELARSLSDTLSTKSNPSTQTHNKPVGVPEEGDCNEKRMKATAASLKQNASFSISSDGGCSNAGGSGENLPLVVEGSRDDWSHHKSEFLGVGFSLPSISVGRPRSQTGITTSKKGKDTMHIKDDANLTETRGKVIDNCCGSLCASKQSLLDPSPSVVPRRHVSQRRLVHHGCISPCNTAKTNSINVDAQLDVHTLDGKLHSFPQVNDANKGKVIELSNNSPIRTEHGKLMLDVPAPANNNMEIKNTRNASGDASGKTVVLRGDNKKGKIIVYDDVASNSLCRKAKSSRVCQTAFEDQNGSAENSGYSMNANDQGWRTTRNYTNQASVSLCDSACGSRRDGNSFLALHDSSSTAVHLPPHSISDNRRGRLARGKRKYGSTSYHPGESSSSLDDPELSYCGSSGQHTSPISTRTRNSRRNGSVLGPVIEIDELCSPKVRRYSSRDRSDDSSSSGARIQLLEADELLARQLQEQLYNESPGVWNTEETDVTIAMSMQQEENARHSSSITSPITRGYQNNPRGASNVHGQPSFQRFSRATSRVRFPIAARTRRLVERFGLPEMDMLMRINLFGEFGAAFHGAEISGLSHIQRDFNENDYEMLLALDDNNQHAGASERQINSLPQSVVQSDNIEEPCSVCLEKPCIGDRIRHLPCLHRFHKDCIDQWLRRKTSCPVCKSGIT